MTHPKQPLLNELARIKAVYHLRSILECMGVPQSQINASKAHFRVNEGGKDVQDESKN